MEIFCQDQKFFTGYEIFCNVAAWTNQFRIDQKLKGKLQILVFQISDREMHLCDQE